MRFCRAYTVLAVLLAMTGCGKNAPKSPVTRLRQAVDQGRTDEVRQLLAGGVSANEPNEFGATAVHVAVLCGRTEPLRALLEAGGDPNRATPAGLTPLHLAVGRGDAEAIRILLQHGAKADQGDARGRTPLHYAQQTHQVDLARLLGGSASGPGDVPPSRESNMEPGGQP